VTEQDEERLAELLLRWDELRELGQDVPASALCLEHPHLTSELARRIHALKATAWLDAPVEADDDAALDYTIQYVAPKTLVRRYRLDHLVAEGGFAYVWRAYDLELHRTVAVKMPKASRLQSTDAFLAEARRVARLNHPSIVSVHDVGIEDGCCFIVSEFVDGGSLADHLARNPPTVQQAVRWIIEVAEAADFAHLHGVIHRDIKPANILIDQHNRALLADFGIAQSSSRAGQQAMSLGTLRYMSPEQLEGKLIDPRSDVFSLGVVLHEAATGKLPYASVEPNVLRREIVSGAQLDEQLPRVLYRICEKALQKDPSKRYTSTSQMALELQRSFDVRKHIGKPLWATFGVSLLLLGLVLFRQRTHLPEPALVRDVVPASPKPGSSKSIDWSELPATYVNSLGMHFVLVPKGTFMQGSALSNDETKKIFGRPDVSWKSDYEDEHPQHQVTIDAPFYLGRYEVTVEQFARFVKATKYITDAERSTSGAEGFDQKQAMTVRSSLYNWKNPGFSQTAAHPVVFISYRDTMAFCQWLQSQDGFLYSPPTESQWEYACRAGSETQYFFGDNTDELTKFANVRDLSLKAVLDGVPTVNKKQARVINANDGYQFTAPVGSYGPNGFGLHDMHGNVWEWCLDHYRPYYPFQQQTVPLGTFARGPVMVNVRGGSWFSPLGTCRSSYRSCNFAGYQNEVIGMRVAFPAQELLSAAK
jgi:formylglycine-generating enzyme required for sulfatase activity/tRNA A-37 threonylcarbamoyl transferase component Bud32